MRSKLLCAIALLGSAAAGAGSAVAADIPVRGAPPAASPAVVAVPEWAGFYVGANGGGGSAHTSFDQGEFERITRPSPFDNFNFPGVSSSGGLGGFQWGHNWQWGQIVGGLEIDFDWSDIKGSSTTAIALPAIPQVTPADPTAFFTQDFKIEELASARGRLGYLIWPNLLAYGTAGIGWAHTRFTTTEDIPLSRVTARSFESNTTFSNEFGWVAGAGLEWKFWNNWFLRGEYLHYEFGKITHPALGPNEDNFNLRTRVDIGRAALSYKFGPP